MKVQTAGPAILSKTLNQPPAQRPEQYHPPIDWWQLGEDRLSTQELLSSGRVTAAGVSGSYHYKLEESDDSGKPRNVLAGAAAGAAMGGVVTTGGAAVLAIIGEFLSVLNPYSRGSGLGSGFFIGAAAIGGLAGAIIGGAGMFEQGRLEEEMGTAISGTLRAETQSDGTSKIAFYPGSSVTERIDVNEYAQSQQLPDVSVEEQAWYMDSLKGAGVGAALGAGVVVPLVGVFAPAAVGYAAGGALSDGEAYGQVLGGALGVGVTAGSIYAVNTLGFAKGLGLGAGVVGAVGAVAGPVVLPRMRQMAAEEAQLSTQWWHRPDPAGAG